MTTTAKNYAVRADRIWVPSSSVGANTTVGNKPLDDTLNSVYGKLFTEEPTTPEEGQLWFDGATLRYRNGSSWETIINAHTPGQVFSGARTSTSETYEAAAKRILSSNSAVLGDIVLVTNATGEDPHEETYIMVGETSDTPAVPVVVLVTSDTTSEVEYTNSGAIVHYLTDGQTVTTNLEALDSAIYGSIRWAEYTSDSNGNFSLTAGNAVPVVAGDVRMLTCKIVIKGGTYISCAQENLVLNNKVIDTNASTLMNFYSTQESGSGIEADGLTFAVDNSDVFTVAGTSVPEGSKVTVWY